MKKASYQLLLVLLVVVALLMWTGYVTVPIQIQPVKITGPTVTEEEAGMVSVDRPLRFIVIDKYGGSGVQSADAYIYNTDLVKLETIDCADSSGRLNSTQSFISGTQLHVEIDGPGSEQMWYDITVPKMSVADKEAVTYNPIRLEYFDYTAPTIQVTMSDGTVVADTEAIDPGNNSNSTNPVITVTWFQGTDNDGMMTSRDPINNVDWNALLVCKVHTGNYEQVTVNGFPYAVEKGSAMYYVYEIPPTEISKWKVGNTYRLPGSGQFTFSMDLTGLSGNTTDFDIYLKGFSDYDYFTQKGSWGPDSLDLLSGTVHDIELREA